MLNSNFTFLKNVSYKTKIQVALKNFLLEMKIRKMKKTMN